MDEKSIRFSEARIAALGSTVAAEGIGRMSEKSVHKIFKLYIEPNEQFHEVKYLGSIADIKNDRGIYEIQTRALYKLIPKLEKFLPTSRVTVVIPVIVEKTIRTLNKKTGEISAPRKSPLHESVYTAFAELYDLRRVAANKNLSFKLLLVKVDEYKYLGGGRGERKIDKIPTALVAEYDFTSFVDYQRFVPESVGERFTAKELCSALGCHHSLSSALAGFLRSVGAISIVAREGRSNVYTLNKSEEYTVGR